MNLLIKYKYQNIKTEKINCSLTVLTITKNLTVCKTLTVFKNSKLKVTIS